MQIFQEIQNREMLIRIMNVAEKQKTPVKWHKNCEICQPVNKPCSFFIDGETISANPGDIIVINEYTPHSFVVTEDDTDVRILLFRPKTIMNQNIKILPLKTHITTEDIASVSGLSEKINMLFKMIHQEDQAEKVQDNPLMQSLIASFFLLLMRHFPQETSKTIQKQRVDFYKIADYINEHFKENINVSILSEKLFMSRERLSQIFLKYSDMKVNDYIDSLRIDNVNRLFKDGLSITEAAFESGFQCIRTFNSTYKKIMGITPSQYVQTSKKGM